MTAKRDVAIVGIHATPQRRRMGKTVIGLMMESIRGSLDDAGLQMSDVDALIAYDFPAGNGEGATDGNVAWQLKQPINFVWQQSGASAVLTGAALIRDGLAEVVVIPAAGAQATDTEATAAYTRPGYEFTEWTGSITPAQFALQARRHMHLYGSTVDDFAYAASTIRNNAHINPEAMMFSRGPYTPADILKARMVADPLTLLMCSLTNDGASCIVLTSAERARYCRKAPVWVLGGAMESRKTSYLEAPSLDIINSRDKMMRGFERLGVRHEDTDMVMIYDHFAHSVQVQMEALGFCQPGEGGAYIREVMGLDQKHPVCPDGGNQGYSHNMIPYNFKIIEIVKQMRNEIIDLCPQSAEGIHTYDRSICRKVRDPKLSVACGPMTEGRHSFVLLEKN